VHAKFDWKLPRISTSHSTVENLDRSQHTGNKNIDNDVKLDVAFDRACPPIKRDQVSSAEKDTVAAAGSGCIFTRRGLRCRPRTDNHSEFQPGLQLALYCNQAHGDPQRVTLSMHLGAIGFVSNLWSQPGILSIRVNRSTDAYSHKLCATGLVAPPRFDSRDERLNRTHVDSGS